MVEVWLLRLNFGDHIMFVNCSPLLAWVIFGFTRHWGYFVLTEREDRRTRLHAFVKKLNFYCFRIQVYILLQTEWHNKCRDTKRKYMCSELQEITGITFKRFITVLLTPQTALQRFNVVKVVKIQKLSMWENDQSQKSMMLVATDFIRAKNWKSKWHRTKIKIMLPQKLKEFSM